MSILAMFRSITVGTDTAGYEQDFYLIHDMSNYKDVIFHKFEPGYAWAIIQYKKISSDYMGFISLTWIPFILGILKFIYDSKVWLAFSLYLLVMLGFYFYSMNGMRQMMACAMILATFPWLQAKKYFIFGIWTVTISLLFHRSEIVYLILIPLHYYTNRNKIISKKFLYLSIISSFLIFYIGNTLLKEYLALLTLFLDEGEYYAGYILNEREEYGNLQSMMFSGFALLTVYCKTPQTYKFETYMFVLSIVIFNVFNTLSQFGIRLYYNFHFIAIFLLSQMVCDKQTKYRKLFFVAIIVFCTVLFVHKFVINNNSDCNPYFFRF